MTRSDPERIRTAVCVVAATRTSAEPDTSSAHPHLCARDFSWSRVGDRALAARGGEA